MLVQEIAMNYEQLVFDFFKRQEKTMSKNKYEDALVIANRVRSILEELNILLDAATREDIIIDLTVTKRDTKEVIANLYGSEALDITSKIQIKKEI